MAPAAGHHQHVPLCCRSSAYSVDLQDILPPAGAFSLLSGSPSAKFDRIAVGATERHSYSVTPKVSLFTLPADSPLHLWLSWLCEAPPRL